MYKMINEKNLNDIEFKHNNNIEITNEEALELFSDMIGDFKFKDSSRKVKIYCDERSITPYKIKHFLKNKSK